MRTTNARPACVLFEVLLMAEEQGSFAAAKFNVTLQANLLRGGKVHVVQMAGGSDRPAFGQTLCGRGVDDLGLRRIGDRLTQGETMDRAANGADWCKNCLRWVARW